jgi:hypothetical protein
VTSKKGLKILIEDGEDDCGCYTKNIVYSEVFAALQKRQIYSS